jgi:hypothetical protein
MSKVTRLPPECDWLPPTVADEPPSLATLVKHEPRGGAIDHAAIVKGAMSVAPLPGASEANQHEAYRQRLIAANRSLDGQVVNELGKGALEGVALAGIGVVWTIFGWEIAAVAGVAVLGAAIFGGGK